ncbi:MAG: hypothetical protein WBB27_07090 [Maribacter sp.]
MKILLFHKGMYPNIVLAQHQDYNLSDEDFLSLIRKKPIYGLVQL